MARVVSVAAFWLPPHGPASTEADSEVKAVGFVRDDAVLVPPNYSSLVLWLITV